MTNNETYTLVNKQTNDLAFKMFQFDSIHHFDHIQRLNYFSLIWIQEGNGKTVADFNTYEYEKDYLFSFAPYQPFMFEENERTKGLVINFHSDFFCILKHHEDIACNGVLFNNVYETPFVKIDEETKSTMHFIIKEMIKDIEENQLAMNESVVSYLKLLLINASRLRNTKEQISEHASEEDSFITQKLKDLIELHFKEKHLPKEYAELLHITPKALAKLSKKHYNKTLSNLISERIIIEAKRELYLTSKSVKEISMELGYEDEFYFSRFFKKNTSTSPSVFRKTVGFAKAEV